MLVQPFISGHGEGVFGLATAEGVQGWSAHRRLRMMNPHGSGSSACVSQPVATETRAVVERFIQQAGWRGLFMVEFLRDRAGKPWFVEFNGRPWGSLALARRQGLEYPAWAAKLALTPEARIASRSPEEKPVVCRNAGREFMHLLFVLRGPKSEALREWPSFWRTSGDMLRVRRNDFFYNWRRDDLSVFFCDGGTRCVTTFASPRVDLFYDQGRLSYPFRLVIRRKMAVAKIGGRIWPAGIPCVADDRTRPRLHICPPE